MPPALFLSPGAEFHVVTDLITNFHLPRSTLLMLVAASLVLVGWCLAAAFVPAGRAR